MLETGRVFDDDETYGAVGNGFGCGFGSGNCRQRSPRSQGRELRRHGAQKIEQAFVGGELLKRSEILDG